MNNGRIPNPSRTIGGSVRVDWFMLILALVVIGVFVLLAISGRQAGRDIREGRAETAEGQVELNIVNARSDSYTARINGKTFNISKAAYEAVMALHAGEGAEAVYRVYYAPGNWKILSLEKLADKPARP